MCFWRKTIELRALKSADRRVVFVFDGDVDAKAPCQQRPDIGRGFGNQASNDRQGSIKVVEGEKRCHDQALFGRGMQV